MVQALVELDEGTNRALNVVKARYGLKDKAAAIKLVVNHYVETEEPPLRTEFIARMRQAAKQPSIRVPDLRKHYEARHVRSRDKTRRAKNS